MKNKIDLLIIDVQDECCLDYDEILSLSFIFK